MVYGVARMAFLYFPLLLDAGLDAFSGFMCLFTVGSILAAGFAVLFHFLGRLTLGATNLASKPQEAVGCSVCFPPLVRLVVLDARFRHVA